MSWFDAIGLAGIHRETYIAILKSWIPHGKKGEFARRVGITREYLSYLCALDYPAENKNPPKRIPSPKLAERIAEALPAPPEVKKSLLENMELAHTHNARAHYATREFIAQRRVGDLMAEIRDGHGLATFGTNLAKVRRSYRVVRDAAANLIPFLSPDIYPASLAQACMYLHDAQCVLDRSDDALRYAKLACLIFERPDFFEPGFNEEEIGNLETNAIRGVGVALHNLGLDREAQDCYSRARLTPAYRNLNSFWKPLVGRDFLNATVNIPRFGFRDAQRSAREIESICERKGDEFTLFMVRESWLRCLIQREKWKQAQQIYREETDRIPNLPYIGSLHRALLIKTGAHLAWKLKDKALWKERIRDAIKLMQQAGLDHQIRTLKQLYGQDLDPIFDTTRP